MKPLKQYQVQLSIPARKTVPFYVTKEAKKNFSMFFAVFYGFRPPENFRIFLHFCLFAATFQTLN